ncbi:MAG: hypothetical protein FWG18_03235, partial [Alphaproteobacteria bacterium]|nr:hypothetical protein [Alphaproteobacteria bacterium]
MLSMPTYDDKDFSNHLKNILQINSSERYALLANNFDPAWATLLRNVGFNRSAKDQDSETFLYHIDASGQKSVQASAAIKKMSRAGIIRAKQDISQGGLITALLEMTFAN